MENPFRWLLLLLLIITILLQITTIWYNMNQTLRENFSTCLIDKTQILHKIEYVHSDPDAYLKEFFEKFWEMERVRNNALGNNVTDISQSALVYINLIDLLPNETSFNTFLKIALEVKKLTLKDGYSSVRQDIKNQLEKIKTKVPTIVKAIVWGKLCILSEQRDYLIKTEFHRSENVGLSRWSQDNWEFQISDTDTRFKFRHVHSGEYIRVEITSPSRDDDLRDVRNVFTTKGDTGEKMHYWSLEEIDRRAQKFLIKNEELNELFVSRSARYADRVTTCVGDTSERDGPHCDSEQIDKIWYLYDSAGCPVVLGK